MMSVPSYTNRNELRSDRVLAGPWDAALLHFQVPLPGEQVSPEFCRQLAIHFALLGLGRVSPNPLVGAVVVDSHHRFLSAASHRICGGDHAEAAVIADLKRTATLDRLAGGKMYVTLEPCAHHGRTPPCADAIARLPIAELEYAVDDPNPLVAGQGLKRIAAAGIKVIAATHGQWHEDCAALSAFFLKTIASKSVPPVFVGLKAAMTADGLLAEKGDRRRWITGERARSYGHFLRQYYDAILIGADTALLDDPHLTVRRPDIAHQVSVRTPWRIVLDKDAKWSHSAQFSSSNLMGRESERNVILTTSKVRLTWNEILATLSAKGIQSVLIEGGGRVYQSALAEGVVQRVHLFQAPTASGLMHGDPQGVWFEGNKANRFVPTNFTVTRQFPLDQDLLVEADKN